MDNNSHSSKPDAPGIETVYSTDVMDPDLHHPDPDCPSRRRAIKSGYFERRVITGYEGSFTAQKQDRDGKRKTWRSIRVCVTCRTVLRLPPGPG